MNIIENIFIEWHGLERISRIIQLHQYFLLVFRAPAPDIVLQVGSKRNKSFDTRSIRDFYSKY